MLDKIISYQKLWEKCVYNFGATTDEVNDIVQDMYLKMATDVDLEKIRYGKDDVNKYYIYVTLKNLFLQYKKDKLLNNSHSLNYELGLTSSDDYDVARDEALFDIIDDIREEVSKDSIFGQKLFEIYFRVSVNNPISYLDAEELSLRDIAKGSNVSLSTIFLHLKRMKENLKDKFGEDIEDYFNGDYSEI